MQLNDYYFFLFISLLSRWLFVLYFIQTSIFAKHMPQLKEKHKSISDHIPWSSNIWRKTNELNMLSII